MALTKEQVEQVDQLRGWTGQALDGITNIKEQGFTREFTTPDQETFGTLPDGRVYWQTMGMKNDRWYDLKHLLDDATQEKIKEAQLHCKFEINEESFYNFCLTGGKDGEQFEPFHMNNGITEFGFVELA